MIYCHTLDGPYFFIVDLCELEKDTGPCFAMITSWYYDQSKGTCSQFYYGGCGGNNNRFSSELACQKQCAHLSDISKQGVCTSVRNNM